MLLMIRIFVLVYEGKYIYIYIFFSSISLSFVNDIAVEWEIDKGFIEYVNRWNRIYYRKNGLKYMYNSKYKKQNENQHNNLMSAQRQSRLKSYIGCQLNIVFVFSKNKGIIPSNSVYFK